MNPCLAHLVISEQRSFASASQLAMRRRSAGLVVFAINELGAQSISGGPAAGSSRGRRWMAAKTDRRPRLFTSIPRGRPTGAT